MKVNNPPKLLGILVAMIIIGVLLGLGSISESAGVPLLTLLVGYLVGNGVAARKGDPVEPALGGQGPPS